jgi:hypothetical protein
MMTEFHQWYQNLQVERTLKALKKNHFDARYVAKGSEALEEILKMIPDGATVGIGGSLTLNQIGFYEAIQKRPVKFLNPYVKGLPPQEGARLRREGLTADVFLSSTNAITEDGKLFNIDATGNRVGGMTFGPKKVIVVCGVNKIVKDLDSAWKKVQEWTSPVNVKRLNMKTPCLETGVCADCNSPERICNVYVVLAKKPRFTDMTIFIVGENLGF